MLGFLMNRWVIGALTGLVMLGFSYWKGYTHGKDVVQKEWDAYKVVQEREVQAQADKSRQIERQMQAKADTIAKEKQNELENLKRKHASIVAGLHDRPRRDTTGELSGNPGTIESPAACTGAELLREDAEFLAGEAARADQIRAELEACYVQYDNAKQLTGR